MNRVALSLGIGLVWATSAASGQRDGLHLAVGAGSTLGSWDIRVNGVDEKSAAVAVTTDFAIGWWLSSRVAVYYLNRAAWFNSPVTVQPPGGMPARQVGRVLTHGLSGVGIRATPGARPTRFFLTGGLGLAWWSQVFEESTSCLKLPVLVPCVDASGVGVTAGVGYQLGRRVTAELAGGWSNPSSPVTDRFEVTSASTTLTLLLQFRLF